MKIVLERTDPIVGLLRAGMSVEATIDTKATVLAESAGSGGLVSVAAASQTTQRRTILSGSGTRHVGHWTP